MDSYKTGKYIAQKRKEKGLTQRALAEKIGVTDKAISKWERGLSCPDISLLLPLSDALGRKCHRTAKRGSHRRY